MNKLIATGAVAFLALGLAGLTAAPAIAEEVDQEICYADETVEVELWDLQRSDWVAGTPASIEDGWYTESDDAAPTIVDNTLVFTAPGGKAVGLRYSTSFPLGELSGQTYTDVFHDRAVLDADGEPFGAGNWRNDYTSLTFLSADTVWVSGLNVAMPLAEVKEAYTGTITSFGYHMDSNAAAGTTAVVNDHVTPATPDSYTDWFTVSSGEGELPDGHVYDVEFQTDALYRYTSTGVREDVVQVEVECPVVVVPPTEEPTPAPVPTDETPAPVAPAGFSATSDTLAETGVNPFAYALGALAVALIGLTAIFGVAARRHNASKG